MSSTPFHARSHPTDGLFGLRLLDPVHGRAVQSWSFEEEGLVRIGRQEDNEVILADPRVSRLHATIRPVDGRWELTSLGQHGVFVRNQRVETLRLQHECVFRLGSTGPALQFVDLDRPSLLDSESGRATLGHDNVSLEALGIDEARAAEEVEEITANESFQRLLGRARELRERRAQGEG